MANIQCPQCGQTIAAQAAPGQMVQCPYCQNVFPVQPAGQAPPPLQAIPGAPPAYPQPVGYATPQGYGVRNVPNGAAAFALICGILPFVLTLVNIALGTSGIREPAIAIGVGIISLLCPFLAIIFGIIGLVKTKDPRVAGKGRAIAGISLGGAVLLLMLVALPMILLPSLSKARETANRVKCAANLKQIGLAMQLYANENRGNYPPRPEDLLLTQDITSEVFICPSTNDTKAPGATPQQEAANLSAGGHHSYIYLGKGKNATAGYNVVLVYEAPTNHKNGFNVLFGDGHVEYLNGAIAQKVMSELQAGQNPPRSYR